MKANLNSTKNINQLLEHVTEIRRAMSDYVKLKEGKKFNMPEIFNLKYIFDSKYIPVMRKIDIQTIDSILEFFIRKQSPYNYELLTAFSTDIYNYLQNIKTGFNFYFFRLGNGSQLRDKIYAVLKSKNPVILLPKSQAPIKNFLLDLYGNIDKLQNRVNALLTEKQAAEHAIELGRITITRLTNELNNIRIAHFSTPTPLVPTTGPLASQLHAATAEINKLSQHIILLNQKIIDLEMQLAHKNSMITRLMAYIDKSQPIPIEMKMLTVK